MNKRSSSDKVICAMFPSPHDQSDWNRIHHPLLPEMAKHLQTLGCKCIDGPPVFPTVGWLLRHRHRIDVIHIHWPELGYTVTNRSQLVRYIDRLTNSIWSKRFLPALTMLKYQLVMWLIGRFEIPLVWTIHDLYPHAHDESVRSNTDRHVRRSLMKQVDVLILNCASAKSIVCEHFGVPKHYAVAPLGKSSIWYPDTISRTDARHHFGFCAQETVILNFGTMRRKRNALPIIEAFGSVPDQDLRLLIAGQAGSLLRSEILKASWSDWRITTYLQLVDNDQIEYFFKASDFVFVHAHDYLTSAVIVLAISFGIPVVAPKFGCAIDQVGGAGLLYDPNEPNCLKKVIERITIVDNDELRQRAMKKSDELSWKVAARNIMDAYRIAIKEHQHVESY